MRVPVGFLLGVPYGFCKGIIRARVVGLGGSGILEFWIYGCRHLGVKEFKISGRGLGHVVSPP